MFKLSKNVSDALLAKIRNGESLPLGEKLNLLVQLSVPSFLAQITTVLMFYIDASMVGSLGAEASAAIGLVEPATWIFSSLCNAISMGFSVQAAHFIGANRFDQARSVMKHGYIFGIALSLVIMAIAMGLAFPLPHWLGGSEDICHDASLYFFIFSATFPIYLIQFFSSAMLKVSGDVRHPSTISVIMCVLDVVFNFFFIFPIRHVTCFGMNFTIWGAGLGVEGAALGTAAAFLCGAIPLVWYAVFRSKILAWRLDTTRFVWVWNYVWYALKIGAPMALQYILMNGAQLVSMMIVAPLGKIAIAAHSFAITAESVCYMPGYGIAEAATTLVGQSVGAGRSDLCRSFARLSVLSGMIVMALMGVLMYIFAPEMIGMLSPVEAIRELGTSVLRIEAFAEPFFAAAIVTFSVCVGAGDTLRPSLINLGTMWLVRLTLAAALATHYGLEGVWFAMATELTLRGLIFLIRLVRGRWLKIPDQ